MSTGPAVAGNGEHSGGMVVRPQHTIGVAAEQQRVQAEIQSRLMVAKSCPRDEVAAIDRIKTACQRIGLAEKAEYSFVRGGSEISGPTIDLLTVVANHWGNVDYGFRELSQQNRESTVEAYAWDLETNSKRTVVFTVPHKRYTNRGVTELTDPRDIYEMVANQAQRRVRACLEAIIPPDVVEDAVSECRSTIKSRVEITPERLSKMLDAFSKYGVTKEQIEARIGRRLDSMQPAQFLSLGRICKSLADGMSRPEDWFKTTEKAADKPATGGIEAAKDALKKRPAAAPESDTHDRPQAAEEVDHEAVQRAVETFAGAKDTVAVQYDLDAIRGLGLNQPTLTAIEAAAAERVKALSDATGGKRTQKPA